MAVGHRGLLEECIKHGLESREAVEEGELRPDDPDGVREDLGEEDHVDKGEAHHRHILIHL